MSRTLDILNAIKSGSIYDKPVLSRSENILTAVCNETENLINVSTVTIEGGALQRFEIPLASVKGKTISASAFVENKSTQGDGARIRIDVTNNGTVSYAMGNDIATGRNGISKAENVSVPATATKVEFSIQSYSGNVGGITFSRFMVNVGSTVKPYTQYITDAKSRYETLLLAIKNGETTSITPKTRLEELLAAIANETLDTWLQGKNLLPNTYPENERNSFGISYKANSDGSIFVNGTSTGFATYFLSRDFKLKNGKTYCISGSTVNARIIIAYKFNGETKYAETKLTWSNDYTLDYIYVQVNPNTTVFETIYPKIEIGETATPYSPYCFKSEIETAFYKAFGAE